MRSFICIYLTDARRLWYTCGMIEQTAPTETTDQVMWEIALVILEQAPDDGHGQRQAVSVRELADMTAEAASLGTETAPAPGTIHNLLRVALSRFVDQHPHLMQMVKTNTRGGWDTPYRWVGPDLADWPKDGFPMPDTGKVNQYSEKYPVTNMEEAGQ